MRTFFFIACVVTLFSFSLPVQDGIGDKIVSVLRNGIDNYPTEKVFLHTDRSYYLSGEKIWLKAYLVAGPAHIPSPLSKVVYVDLLNPKGNVVENLTLLTKEGSSNGSIVLPDSLASGQYTLRGYTSWMRNFPCDYFFSQDVKIWNLFAGRHIKDPAGIPTQGKIDLQFFPEGGTLVAGMFSKVGFKAINSNGLGVTVSGKVVDNSGKEVATIESNALGMGFFSFVAEPKVTYKAVLVKPYSTEYVLPKAKEKGVGLFVTNNPQRPELIVRVQTNLDQPMKEFYLVGQTRGVLCYASKVTLPSTFITVKVPKQNFPKGIAQISLFDVSGNPIGERLVFVDKKDDLLVKVETDKMSYKPREKVTLSIELVNEKGNPVAADLSVSVCDANQVLIDENSLTISSFLNLTSDLKGNIESPEYYFNAKNIDRVDALDALMLTQGWRRFNWEDILANRWPMKNWTPEQGIFLRGKLVDKFSNKPLPDGKIMLMEGGVTGDLISTKSGVDGSFLFTDLQMYDTSHLALQAENKRGNKSVVRVLLDTLIKPSGCEVQKPALEGTITNYESDFVKRGLRNREIDASYNFDQKDFMLEGVEVKAAKIERTVQKVYGAGSKTINTSEVKGSASFLSPLQLLQGTPGVQLLGSGTSLSVQIRGVGSVNAGNAPLILLDNSPIAVESINRIPVQSIESVEVFKGADAVVFGTQGANGVVAFYSKTGSEVNPVSSEGFFPIKNVGYHYPREFYSPKYDVVRPEHVKPDERVLLFWNPTIRTNSGKASLEFYNHDLESPVKAVINGLSADGLPIHSVINYQIKK
jgi:hypothetical protein